MIVLSAGHAAGLLRHFRRGVGMSQAELGRRLYVDRRTIHNRERRAATGMPVATLIATADVFGLDVALVPKVRRRATGTGWPQEDA